MAAAGLITASLSAAAWLAAAGGIGKCVCGLSSHSVSLGWLCGWRPDAAAALLRGYVASSKSSAAKYEMHRTASWQLIINAAFDGRGGGGCLS